jgi:hypothetical protein
VPLRFIFVLHSIHSCPHIKEIKLDGNLQQRKKPFLTLIRLLISHKQHKKYEKGFALQGNFRIHNSECSTEMKNSFSIGNKK